MDSLPRPAPLDELAPRVAAAERFQGAAMVAVLILGFAMAVAALLTPAARRQLANASGAQALIAGRTAAAVNYATAHYLPVDELFRAAGGVLRWRLFGSGGPQVWVGRQGWLFLMEELRPWPNAESAMQSRVATVQSVARGLQANGIQLLVALVPDKARMARDLVHGPISAQEQERYADILSLMAGAGLRVVNLADAFAAAPRDRPLFYRTDTHWNQEGAALAARVVAGAASATAGIDRSHHFKTTADTAETDGPGDLLRLMSLDQVSDRLPIPLRPRIDRQHLEHTAEVDPPAGGGGLLDEGPAIEVALVGSSYSLNANFAGRLQEALGAPLVNLAEAGGGFAGSALKYFRGATFKETPPKLVVWEIPERVVGQPISAEDRALAELFAAPPPPAGAAPSPARPENPATPALALPSAGLPSGPDAPKH